MKRMLLGIIVLGTFSFANAQTFKPFRADAMLGYAIPGGTGSKGGVIAAFEPHYAVNDNISLGLRFEAAITARAAIDKNGNSVSGSVKASGSYLVTGDYYFNTSNFRPFIGLGAGMFSLAAVDVAVDSSNTSQSVAAGTKFGFTPRVGFDLGHFRMAVEYNIAGKTGTINNNYLGIKMGFFIGGGRFKK